MRSPESPTCRPHRHFGAVALHNCALRIISQGREHMKYQLARRGEGIDLLGQRLQSDAATL
jgi:hypothetical protein